jgi:hypothetical protein
MMKRQMDVITRINATESPEPRAEDRHPIIILHAVTTIEILDPDNIAAAAISHFAVV